MDRLLFYIHLEISFCFFQFLLLIIKLSAKTSKYFIGLINNKFPSPCQREGIIRVPCHFISCRRLKSSQVFHNFPFMDLQLVLLPFLKTSFPEAVIDMAAKGFLDDRVFIQLYNSLIQVAG